VVGSTIFEFLPAELAKLRTEDDQRVMASRQPFKQIEESRFQTNTSKYIYVVKIPILDASGEVTGLQGMFWDITDIKLAEQRLQSARDKLAVSEERLRLKNAEMQNDLQTAREVQIAMLPQQFPVLPRGVSPEENCFQFTQRYLPSGTVGGDFYSVNPISDLEVGVFLCDVAGHGVQSALITTMIRALVEDLRPLAADPGQFMTGLNAKLHAILNPGGSTVLTTAIYLVANAATAQVRFVNAGHARPFLLRHADQAVEEISNHGGPRNQPVLGLFDKNVYQSAELKLGAGDLVMLFTDGLYEISSAEGQLYSRDLLAAAIRRHRGAAAGELFDHLIEEARHFAADAQFEDDVCILGMQYTPGGPAKLG